MMCHPRIQVIVVLLTGLAGALVTTGQHPPAPAIPPTVHAANARPPPPMSPQKPAVASHEVPPKSGFAFQSPLLRGELDITAESGSVETPSTTTQSVASTEPEAAAVAGRPTGTSDPCADPLADRHAANVSPQTNTAVQVTTSLKDQKYRVKIAPAPAVATAVNPILFVAFSLQARAGRGLTPVGTWELDDAEDGDVSAKFVDCNGGSVLVSGQSATPKTEVAATWTPPAGFSEEAHFLASVVGATPQIYWVGIKSQPIVIPSLWNDTAAAAPATPHGGEAAAGIQGRSSKGQQQTNTTTSTTMAKPPENNSSHLLATVVGNASLSSSPSPPPSQQNKTGGDDLSSSGGTPRHVVCNGTSTIIWTGVITIWAVANAFLRL